MPRSQPPPPADALLDFQSLIVDAARAALATQRYDDFQAWLVEHLGDHAPPDSPLRYDPDLQRAFALAFGRAFWSSLPLPRLDFRCEPVAAPGRNDPCPCGSGRKHKRCCGDAPPLQPIEPSLVWEAVLGVLSPADKANALRSPHLPRQALLHHADDLLEDGESKAAIALLEPLLLIESPRDDELAAHMLDTLCNAYDERAHARRRKLALLRHVTVLPRRSALRSSAHQRLACIEMDAGDPAAAWEAFRRAQQDEPTDPALGMLEVQLLIGENRMDEARDRARFFRAQLRRRGEQDLTPELLAFYDALADDPQRALSDFSFDMEGGAGRALAAWLETVRDRPLPRYALVAVQDAVEDIAEETTEEAAEDAAEDAEEDIPQNTAQGVARPDALLQEPDSLTPAREAWHAAFELEKPFSIQPLPFDVPEDPWESATERRWSAVLGRHPECFDSLDVLDDLATAVLLHGQVDQSPVRERLLRPVLERAAAIVEAALASATPQPAPPQLPWLMTENRPGLRSLFRLFQLTEDSGSDEDVARSAARLLEINPNDNHGLRDVLSNLYVKLEKHEACVALYERYPEDAVPDLALDAALALYRLGRAKAAGKALRRAARLAPEAMPYLLDKRIARPPLHDAGVTMDGPDRGWFYRKAMRSEWLRTPGALDWATTLLR